MSDYANWENGASAQTVRSVLKTNFETLEKKISSIKVDLIHTSQININEEDWEADENTGNFNLSLIQKINNFNQGQNKILNINPNSFNFSNEGFIYSDIKVSCTIEVVWK